MEKRARDEKWVVPILFLIFVALVIVTNLPSTKTWYNDVQDYQISSVSSEELAGWVIQQRNDFLPLYCKSDLKSQIDNIPGLVNVTQGEGGFSEQLSRLPNYKKWVIITPDGTLPDPAISAILTEDARRRVIILKGGAQEWDAKITKKSITGLKLSREESIALKKVRPFFHKSLISNTSQQDRFIAAPVARPPMLKAKKVQVEEEGC